MKCGTRIQILVAPPEVARLLRRLAELEDALRRARLAPAPEDAVLNSLTQDLAEARVALRLAERQVRP